MTSIDSGSSRISTFFYCTLNKESIPVVEVKIADNTIEVFSLDRCVSQNPKAARIEKCFFIAKGFQESYEKKSKYIVIGKLFSRPFICLVDRERLTFAMSNYG